MFKLAVILLIVSMGIFSVSSTGKLGIMQKFKKGFQKQPEAQVVEKFVVIQEPAPCQGESCNEPCKSDKCKPKPDYEDRPCKSKRCKACRNECNDDKCFNQCIVVDKCRNDCNGSDKCMDECDGRGQSDQCNKLLTQCESGKSLCYVQVPKTITVSEFVSNSNLLDLYAHSNLELDSNGISGRACLNDKTRYELTQLNATILSIANIKK